MLKFLLLFFPIIIQPQTKIVYTAVDYSLGEVRAAICDDDGGNKYDLGFSKTYLPVWFGDDIVYNSDTFIWQCDTTGENLKQIIDGYRITVSNDQTKYAFYDYNGISIADKSGKLIKEIHVDAWQDVTITWSLNDEHVSFYNNEKDECFLFHLENDSLISFGKGIYHPLWNKSDGSILYNARTLDELYDVVIKDASGKTVKINKPGEMAVVPIWSSSGNKVAYMVIKYQAEQNVDSDMLESYLMLYDMETKVTKTLAHDAGFTDQAFPQMCFDENDNFIYYTAINEQGLGSLKKINLNSYESFTISKDPNIDERFPQVKTFN
jgi:hypothetical protein